MVTEAEEKVVELQKQLNDLQNTKLTATDMFTLIDRESKHKTMLIVVLMICWLLTIAGFIWYLTLPIEESVYVENEDGNTAYIGENMNGDFNYGENTSKKN